MSNKKKRYQGIMASFIHYNGVPETFLRSMWQSLDAGVLKSYTSSSSSRTNGARTENVKNFLESNCEWIMFVDTDMSWEPEDIRKLKTFATQKHKKAVAAFAIMPKNGLWPNAFKFVEPDSYVPWGEIEPFSEPIQVDAVGGSSFLVHREVIEAVKELVEEQGGTDYLWQDEAWSEHNGHNRGEDVEFCHRINQVGYEIWYHPDSFFIHWKPQPIGPGQYVNFLANVRAERNKLANEAL